MTVRLKVAIVGSYSVEAVFHNALTGYKLIDGIYT